MNAIKEKFLRFMYGRYGVDELYKGLLTLYITLVAVNLFVRSVIISVLLWTVFIYMMLRCFSKNIYKRQQENIIYLQATEKIRKKFSMTKTMLTDKEHYYKKCPKCKSILRLKRVSGEHTARCPKCSESVQVKIK